MKIRDLWESIDVLQLVDIYKKSEERYLAKELAIVSLHHYLDLEVHSISAIDVWRILVIVE